MGSPHLTPHRCGKEPCVWCEAACRWRCYVVIRRNAGDVKALHVTMSVRPHAVSFLIVVVVVVMVVLGSFAVTATPGKLPTTTLNNEELLC